MEPNHTGTTAKKASFSFPFLLTYGPTKCSDSHHLDGIRLSIFKSLRIWMRLFNLMRIRIRPFTTMRIRIHHQSDANLRPQAYGYRSSTAPFEPSRLQFGPLWLLNFNFDADPDSDDAVPCGSRIRNNDTSHSLILAI